MTGPDWIVVGVAAGSATYIFRSLPFVLGERSPLRRPKAVRFATLTALAVTAGLVSTTIYGGGADYGATGLKLAAVGVALALAPRFGSALVPLFAGVGTATALRLFL